MKHCEKCFYIFLKYWQILEEKKQLLFEQSSGNFSHILKSKTTTKVLFTFGATILNFSWTKDLLYQLQILTTTKMLDLEVIDFERCWRGKLAKVAFPLLASHFIPKYCENLIHESLAQTEEIDMTYDMNIWGIWACKYKIFIAKEIQKCPFANSSKNSLNLFVTHKQTKNTMIANEIKAIEKQQLWKKSLFVCALHL